MLKIDTAGAAYSPASKAYEIAAQLQVDDEDWEYRVIKNPDVSKDSAIIKVYDEDGEFVGNWG